MRPHVTVDVGQAQVEMNVGLYEESGLARVVIGGPASGTVWASPDSYLLSLADIERNLHRNRPDTSRATYASAVVHFAGYEIRTWLLAGHSPEEHVQALVSWLLAGSADVLSRVSNTT